MAGGARNDRAYRGARERSGDVTREEYVALVGATGLSAEEAAGMRALEEEDRDDRMAKWCDERAAGWDKVPGRSWLASMWRKQAAAWREFMPPAEAERVRAQVRAACDTAGWERKTGDE
jgi:hypothetical protein